jgi:hypothetical protein
VHAWLACAYGQRFADIQKASPHDPALGGLRDKALEEAETAVKLDSAMLDVLRAVWTPPPGSTENDLAAFAHDADFIRLLA